MTNISFDNPYLLLIAIPLLALVFIPYFIAIRKENSSVSTILSLIIHTVMVVAVSLAFAGLHKTTIKTETEVIVVADVSYSADKELDKIDAHINNLLKEGNLPLNSKLGVVCFAKDSKINTELGGQFTTVKNMELDTSETDISSALEYASSLFSPNAIKRIVLITDGKQNVDDTEVGLINSIKNMEVKDILVDAIYVNSNLQQGEKEVQLTSINYISSTYLNTPSVLEVLIQSNTDYVYDQSNSKDRNDAYIRLYNKDGVLVKTVSKQLQKGYNLVYVDLDTSVAGVMDYTVVVEANHDKSPNNNSHTFTQTVADKQKILLVSTKQLDLDKAKLLYGEDADIDAPIVGKRRGPYVIPYSLEELCKYDEIILSDIDVNEIENATAFVANLDTVVSKFGKSLITAGNTFIQNQEDQIYKTLEDMLAIKYGNTEGEPKLYALVIDSSRSMQDASQLIMAKETAIQLLNMMAPQDNVIIISFSGDVSIVQRATPAAYKEELIQAINSIKPTQGTVIGAAMRVAYELMNGQNFYEKRVMLISDGRSYTSANESDDAIAITAAMYTRARIYTSVVNTNSQPGVDLLTRIKNAGHGNYYFVREPEEVKDVVSTDIADDLTQTVIEGDIPVIIEDYNDPLVSGMTQLPNIGGYYYGSEKSSATVVLSVDYKKPSGSVVNVPIYSYWSYGNGKVTSISTSFSGNWIENWENDENGKEVYKRILSTNTPKERIDYPFNAIITFEGGEALLEIIPGENNPDFVVDIEITSPSGEVTVNKIEYYNGSYSMKYKVEDVGKYRVGIKYSHGEQVFEASTVFDFSYKNEYNSFELFDSAALYGAIGNNGKVIESGELVLVNDEDKIDTYVFYYTAQLMIAAIVLYLIDIIIRKIKWSDIKSLFGKGKAGGGTR